MYRYYCVLRPPAPGAIPKCKVERIKIYDERSAVLDIENMRTICRAWGFFETEEKLTDEQAKDYDLVEEAIEE